MKIAILIRSLVIALPALCWCHTGLARGAIPQLEKQGDTLRLPVNGKPFLVLGGELGNSSASSADYMQPVWPRLKAMNLNTVLTPVYWELLEPREGEFDFAHVDYLIDAARDHGLKNGVWRPGRRLNGDQTHQGRHLRIPAGDYGIQRLELYTYCIKNTLAKFAKSAISSAAELAEPRCSPRALGNFAFPANAL